MTFQAINSPVTDQIIKALCNTLVHSLWQGVLLAAIAGLIVIFTKRASSALRYNLLISALSLFAIGTVITFTMQLQQVNYAQTGQLVNTLNGSTVMVQPVIGPVIIQPHNFTAVLAGYLNTYHNTIVLIWFLVICAKSIQLGVGLYATYRLKRVNIAAVSHYWDERMKQLACLLGIRQTISLLESGIAKVPMVIGHLKPVILIPIGLLTALSADEVEAILVHELAHIKRRDYLVNMLQSLMEIIFFFNPAVLWISQLIKTERENCCDDMVVEQSSNKISYIRALVSCEEYQSAVPAYAMAFPGSKNSLLDRVKRLATNRNHSLNLFEKTLLAICLVVSGLCVSAFAARENIKRTVHAVVKAFEHSGINAAERQKLAEQTNLLQQQTVKIRKNTVLLSAHKPQLILINDTIKSKVHTVNINVDPVNISVPNVKVHLDPLNVQVSSNVNVHLDPLNVSLGNLAGPLGKVDTNYHRGRGAAANRPFREIARELFKQHLITDTNHFSISLNEHELSVNGVKQSDEVHKEIYAKYGDAMRGTTFASYYSKPNGDDNSTSSSYSNSNSNSNSNSYSLGYGASAHVNSSSGRNSYSSTYSNPPQPKMPPMPRQPIVPKAPVYADQNKYKEDVKEIIADLEKDGLISNRNHITFHLSDKEFNLNGKKQSDEVFQKYKKKYAPENSGKGWNWSHSYNNDTKPE